MMEEIKFEETEKNGFEFQDNSSLIAVFGRFEV